MAFLSMAISVDSRELYLSEFQDFRKLICALFDELWKSAVRENEFIK